MVVRHQLEVGGRPGPVRVGLRAAPPDRRRRRVRPGHRRVPRVWVTISRHGQRLNVNVPFVGRGHARRQDAPRGWRDAARQHVGPRDEPHRRTASTARATDGSGAFVIAPIPVGNVLIEAVNDDGGRARLSMSERIPFGGATRHTRLVLIDAFRRRSSNEDASAGTSCSSDGAAPGRAARRWWPTTARTSQFRCRVPGAGRAVRVRGRPSAGPTPSAPSRFEQLPAGSRASTPSTSRPSSRARCSLDLAPSRAVTFNVLLVGGLGTVRGTVLDSAGRPVPGAGSAAA